MQGLRSWLPLEPLPLDRELAGLVGRELDPTIGPACELYLDMAEAIVDQARERVDDRGVVVDPVEGHDDRWQGGTAARFAYPAAILVERRGRADLLPAAVRALDQLCGGILASAAGDGSAPPGVLDLTMKEIVIAYDLLRQHVDPSVAGAWRQALARLNRDHTVLPVAVRLCTLWGTLKRPATQRGDGCLCLRVRGQGLEG